MSEVEPAPTIVVGVGQAGLDVIGMMESGDGLGWGEQYDDYFSYVAIDSSRTDVTSVPDKATKVHLAAPQRFLEDSQKQYPYLTESLELSGKGAKRQRPVGRYKLDNLDQPSWDSHFDKISNAIERHIRRCNNDPDIDTKQLNVIHVHSLGGGTGSGTFPLLGQMLNEIVDDLMSTYSTDIYTAGIGIVPEITYGINLTSPPGDARYYANTYAALNDLVKLFESSSAEPLPIHLYSKHINMNPDLDRFVFDKLPEPQSEITHSPYTHYFMLGVDEDQIDGNNKAGGPETYRKMVDNTIVAAIYGIAMYGTEIENWMPKGDVAQKGFDKFGSFGQTQLSVPIEDVRAYCNLQERIAELRREVDPEDPESDGELIATRNQKIKQRDELRELVDNPEQILRQRENQQEIQETVTQEVQLQIKRDDDGLTTSSADIDDLADTIRKKYDEEIIAYVMETAEERIEDLGKGIREGWREVINRKYKSLEVASEPGFGVGNETTAEKAGDLNRFLENKIEELQTQVNELEDQGGDGDDGGLFDIDLFSGNDELEQAREWLSYYRTEKDEFKEWEQKKSDVETLKQEVRDRRDAVLNDIIKPRIEDLNEDIENLNHEIEEKQDALTETIEDKEDKIEELTDAEYGERIGYLSLDEQKVREELNRDVLEKNLTSLAAFDEEGYLARNIENRIERRIERSFAWESKLMSWQEGVNLPFGGGQGEVREVWMLHSEENQSLPEFDILSAGDHRFLRFGSADTFPKYGDPYTLQFVSYTLDSPITDLKMYAELDNAAEDGTLDAITERWSDYRLAFAYPEWYDREIQKVFEIEVSEELPRLPELDESKVDVDKEGGEFKNWLSSYGIASYLWGADEWEDYDGLVTVDGFDSHSLGWKHVLRQNGLEHSDMRNYVPNGKPVKLWHADRLSWDELLEEITDNLTKEEGIDVKLVPEE